MTNKEQRDAIARATQLGAEAFARGAKAAPALDPEFAKFLRALPRTESFTRFALRVLQAWNKGWHAANVCAPVEIAG